jgi:acetyltransferase
MWRYSENLRALYETPAPLEEAVSAKARSTIEGVIHRARTAERTLLTEVESKQILAAGGIQTVETRVAQTEEDAVRVADELGYPVVLKLFSETITHKGDVGGVQLDLRDAVAVRNAWRHILASVSERAGPEHFSGVTVQPMITRVGFELILGSSIDSEFGPVLLFGAGGRLVEVFKDTVLGLPPLNATLARRLMEQTRIYDGLRSARDLASKDLDALAEVLIRFSNLVAEQPWISEIDINPLLLSPGQIVALDARIVIHPAGASEAQLSRLAIRPYPTRYVTTRRLKDGSEVTLRPIRPEDEPLMIKFHQALSDRSVYLRYLGPLPLAGRIAHERLSRICFLDCDREIALVVERRDSHTGQPEILGVGRLSKLHDNEDAEFALLVSDPWQGQGVGTQLIEALIEVGRQEDLHRITGVILAENPVMRHIAEKAGFALRHEMGTYEYLAELKL